MDMEMDMMYEEYNKIRLSVLSLLGLKCEV